MAKFSKRHQIGASRLVAIAAVLIAQNVAAQDEGSDEADRIIVTGTREQVLTQETPTGSRLGLSVLETPASVAVVTGDDLRARGDLSIIDAVSRAPGVTNDGNPGNAGLSFAMRGFNGQGSVMQLYDGIRLYPNNGSISFPSDPLECRADRSAQWTSIGALWPRGLGRRGQRHSAGTQYRALRG